MCLDTQVFSYQQVGKASQVIRSGGLVAFPTETVYGLGALAHSDQAVRRVFEAKGRPADNPLIVHISSTENIHQWVDGIPPLAQPLMETFWPGPLTLIFPVKPGVFSSFVTGGQDTVALRMPGQLEALMLIDMVGSPIVGPSANLSTKPSPTRWDHVLHDLKGRIHGILKSQKPLAAIGIESTVVYPQEDQVVILRPGVIQAADIQAHVSAPVTTRSEIDQLSMKGVMSPGVKYRHYSPRQPVWLIESHPPDPAHWTQALERSPGGVAILAEDAVVQAFQDHPRVMATYSLGPTGSSTSANQHLYAGLRVLEETACQVILLQGFSRQGPYAAYMNRADKASSYRI